MSHILIVEDEPVIRGALRKLLERHEHNVVEAESVEQACEQSLPDFDLVISDLRLPGAHGTDLITSASPTPVLIMTSYASLRSAVDAMKLGAVDYIAKPFDHDEMVAAVDRILTQKLAPRAAARSGKRTANPEQKTQVIIGDSEAMRALQRRMERVAVSDSTVLITGESGTGKELVAQMLHSQGSRHRGPFIAVNCAALAADQIESEIFGHEKGAFAAAQATHRGLAESAHGGCLFLEDIDEMPMEAQGRLLRLLQDQEVRRIGSVEPRKVDVRLVAASHRDLAKQVRDGRFREDLYYRLNVLELKVPPLRDRQQDIELLANHFLENTCARLGFGELHFSDDAVFAMTHYYWPGNVRELSNVIERAVIMSEKEEITAEELNIDPGENRGFQDPSEELSLEDYFARFVLENQDHMTETELARKLGISRKCLWERRQRLSIPRKKGSAVG